MTHLNNNNPNRAPKAERPTTYTHTVDTYPADVRAGHKQEQVHKPVKGTSRAQRVRHTAAESERTSEKEADRDREDQHQRRDRSEH